MGTTTKTPSADGLVNFCRWEPTTPEDHRAMWEVFGFRQDSIEYIGPTDAASLWKAAAKYCKRNNGLTTYYDIFYTPGGQPIYCDNKGSREYAWGPGIESMFGQEKLPRPLVPAPVRTIGTLIAASASRLLGWKHN